MNPKTSKILEIAIKQNVPNKFYFPNYDDFIRNLIDLEARKYDSNPILLSFLNEKNYFCICDIGVLFKHDSLQYFYNFSDVIGMEYRPNVEDKRIERVVYLVGPNVWVDTFNQNIFFKFCHIILYCTRKFRKR